MRPKQGKRLWKNMKLSGGVTWSIDETRRICLGHWQLARMRQVNLL
jgi:hypothetical protein